MNFQTQDTPAFWQQLGRFVQQFADAEFYAHLLLWELVGIEDGIAPAVFPEGMRLTDVLRSLRRVYAAKVQVPQAIDQINNVLGQLERISQFRNLLLHNGTEFSPSGAHTTKRVARLRGANARPPRHPVSIENLNALSSDCARIVSFLSAQSLIYSQSEPANAATAAAGSALSHYMDWRYMPEG